jgi:P27 family predicted phage terminase small subunit
MAAKAKRPAAPKGLADAGKSLWRSILGDLDSGWELDARELYLLERACRCADELAALEAAVDRDGTTVTGSRGQTTVHPALSEARQLRLVQLRLLAAIEVADPAVRTATPAQARARKAAESRWGTLNRRAGRG